ncbi:hypothetical protein [Pseudomonas putida]|uniref:hypothetical protein n=1 Tax=Pseudomonas putida TaxID=303 RepID=UPI00300F5901
MPTENRSSNTEMVSVSRDLIDLALAHLPNDSAAKWEIHEVLAQPAPQHNTDPIAWMVGTAIWWTKVEAERDAAATGLPIVGLGPITDRATVELAESETMAAMAELAECEAMAGMVAEREWAEHVGTGDVSSKVEAAFTQLHNDLGEAGEKLAERDALLRDIASGYWELAIELPADLLARLQAISASAEPSAPTWSCQACQLEQPTDRPCDARGGQTALISAKS